MARAGSNHLVGNAMPRRRLRDRIKPPPLINLAFETRVAFAEGPSTRLVMPLLKRAPKGDGHPVMLLPGLLSGERAMHPLRNYLRHQGYDAHTWRLGRNFGLATSGGGQERIDEKFLALYEAAGQRPITLVGWSLGGILARECARRNADKVRQLITLASPFNGDPFAVRSFDMLRYLGGLWGSRDEARNHFADVWVPPEEVPSTAIYSRSDALIPADNAREQPGDLTDNIEVFSSHLGMAVNPTVLYALADRLQFDKSEWRPFRRDTRLKKLLYPSAGH